MSAVTFDTLKASRNLKAAGFDESQANAIVDTLGDAFGDTVATKTDLARLEARVYLAMLAQGAAIVAILRFLA